MKLRQSVLSKLFIVLLILVLVVGAIPIQTGLVYATTEEMKNNTKGTATPISLNKTYYGEIDDEYERDYYKFTLTKPGAVCVYLNHSLPDKGEFRMELLNYEYTWPTGSYPPLQGETAIVDFFNSSWKRKHKTLSETLYLPEGTYYIKISGEDVAGEKYNFTVLYSERNSIYPPGEYITRSGYQEYRTTAPTKIIKPNTTYSERLIGEYDYCNYRFEINSESDVSVSINNSNSANTDYGIVVMSYMNVDNKYSSYIEKDEKIKLPAGTYKVHLSKKSSVSNGDRSVLSILDTTFEFRVNTSPSQKSSTVSSRIFGSNRYKTASNIAKTIKNLRNGQAFTSIVVATGDNYPDALAGSVLAIQKDAPIILTTQSNEKEIIEYIKNNLKKEGTVYVLGGTGAVGTTFETKLKVANIKYKRLGGKTRYETNLSIFNELTRSSNTLIVATGSNYPDALSASAVGYPILIVGDNLTNEQIKYLQKNKFKTITIVGGTGVVSNKVSGELSKYSEQVNRVSGGNRYETSQMIAKRFFNKTDNIVLSIGTNFPDALTGGPLANILKAPMVLTSNNPSDYAYAKDYKKSSGATTSTVLGGSSLISDSVVNAIMK